MEESSYEKEETLMRIKEVISEVAEKQGLEIDKIILFGSRARGDYKKESDWDILVIIKNSLNRKDYISFYSACIRNLFNSGIKKIDLTIIEKNIFEERKHIINTIASEAAIEGIAL